MYYRAIELFFARSTGHVLPRCKTAGDYPFRAIDTVFDRNKPFPVDFHDPVYMGTKPDPCPQRQAGKNSSINVKSSIYWVV